MKVANKKIEYELRKGFYNLSKKPKTLSKKDHERVQELQMGLMAVEERKDEYMKDARNWRIAQQMSAKLQQVILTHYSHY